VENGVVSAVVVLRGGEKDSCCHGGGKKGERFGWVVVGVMLLETQRWIIYHFYTARHDHAVSTRVEIVLSH
jgi:hypothetical protein